MADMKFHDTSSSAVNDEVLIVDIKNGGDVCTVSKVTDRNIKLVPYDTSRRRGSEEAMDDKVFHEITRNVANDEALMDDKGNDGDDYVVLQEAVRNNEWVPYDTPRREENE